jgi:HEAT repeat protein
MSRTLRLLAGCLLPALVLLTAGPARTDEAKVFEKTKREWLTILEKDEKPRMRKAAVIALGIFGPGQKDVLPALTKALAGDKDDAVRLQAATILNQVGKNDLRDSLPTLADVVKDDKSPAVKAEAARLIGKLGELAKPALVPLTGALKDQDAGVRAAVVETIGRIGPEAKSAVTAMLPLLKDPDAGVRFAAVQAYARIGPDAAFVVPDLGQVLENDAAADVRREAAKTLSLMGPDAKHAVGALAKALREDKAAEVRRQAALALGKVSDITTAVPAMKEALKKDDDKNVRLYVVRSLSNALGDDLKDHVKDLADRLNKDPDGDVRLAIVQELAGLGALAKDAVPALELARSDVVLQIREDAKKALQKIQNPPKKEVKKEAEKEPKK